jgi:hypothetical protein
VDPIALGNAPDSMLFKQHVLVFENTWVNSPTKIHSRLKERTYFAKEEIGSLRRGRPLPSVATTGHRYVLFGHWFNALFETHYLATGVEFNIENGVVSDASAQHTVGPSATWLAHIFHVV